MSAVVASGPAGRLRYAERAPSIGAPWQARMNAHVTLDRLLTVADSALRTLSGVQVHASRPCPVPGAPQPATLLDAAEKRQSGALMRVNHVGEVCAQALYQSQALCTRDPQLKAHFERAAREETDHLAWTQSRLHDLGARTSLLNPLWYAGAFGIGLLAGRAGDSISLGFVVETERQVEQHLQSHLDRLPSNGQRLACDRSTDEGR